MYFFSNPSQYISPTYRIDLHSNFSTCSLTAKDYLYVGHILTEKDIELWCFILHPVYKNKQTRKTKTKNLPEFMFIVRESFNPDMTNQIIPLDQRIFPQHFLFWFYTFVIINSLLQCVVDTWRNSAVSLLALLPLLIIFADTHHCPQTDLIPTIKCKEESKRPQLAFWFVVLNDNNKSFIQIYPHAFFRFVPTRSKYDRYLRDIHSTLRCYLLFWS